MAERDAVRQLQRTEGVQHEARSSLGHAARQSPTGRARPVRETPVSSLVPRSAGRMAQIRIGMTTPTKSIVSPTGLITPGSSSPESSSATSSSVSELSTSTM